MGNKDYLLTPTTQLLSSLIEGTDRANHVKLHLLLKGVKIFLFLIIKSINYASRLGFLWFILPNMIHYIK